MSAPFVNSVLIALSTLTMSIIQPAQAARLEQWLPFKFSEGLVSNPSLFPERKVGYIDRQGKTVVEPKFEAARPFNQGLAAVRVKGKWGYIDHQGHFAIEPKFDAVGVLDYPGDDPIDFSEDCAAVRTGGRVGFIDRKGNFVIPARYTSAWEFRDGLAAVQDSVSGKWGFIDKEGKYVIPPTFRDALSFSCGLAAVSIKPRGDESGWGYIDKTGKLVVPPEYSLALSFHEGLALVLTMKDGVYTGKYINSKGETAFTDLNCHGGNAFSQGLAPVVLKDYKLGYVDKTGKIAIEPRFLEARSFSEDVAVVRIDDNTWGLIDKSGHILLSRSIK